MIVQKNSEEEAKNVGFPLSTQEVVIKTESLDLIVYYLSNLNLSVDLAAEIVNMIITE